MRNAIINGLSSLFGFVLVVAMVVMVWPHWIAQTWIVWFLMYLSWYIGRDGRASAGGQPNVVDSG